MSRSPTITNPDWLHNTHPGEMLWGEFMEPLALDAHMLASAIEYPVDKLGTLISGQRVVDAELDLRLTRYFGLTAGYFLRLQIQHDIIDAKRRLNGELERIVPRAA